MSHPPFVAIQPKDTSLNWRIIGMAGWAIIWAVFFWWMQDISSRIRHTETSVVVLQTQMNTLLLTQQHKTERAQVP